MKIYICHRFGNKEENKLHVETLIKQLIEQESSFNTYISPIHCFGFLYNDVEYKQGITYCLELLKSCDAMYVFNGYSNSNGCLIERQYCKDNNIPIKQYFI